MNPDPHFDEVVALVERAREVFAGQNAAVVGSALAELLAIWIASRIVVDGRDEDYAAMRAELLAMHIMAVTRLARAHDAERATGGFEPPFCQEPGSVLDR